MAKAGWGYGWCKGNPGVNFKEIGPICQPGWNKPSAGVVYGRQTASGEIRCHVAAWLLTSPLWIRIFMNFPARFAALYVNNQASSTVTRFDTGREQARAVVTGLAQPRH